MKKRLLGIMLALIMVVSVLPMAVSSLTYITSIRITDVEAPVAGRTANFDFSVPGNANYTIRYGNDTELKSCWGVYETEPTTAEAVSNGVHYFVDEAPLVFEAGKYYVFIAWIKASGGFAFLPDATATMNGESAHFYDPDTAGDPSPVVWKSFYCAPLPDVTAVDITGVTIPAAGETASFDFSIPAGMNYEVRSNGSDNGCWVVTTEYPYTFEQLYYGSNYFYTQELVFEVGMYYTFVAWVEPAVGYKFAEDVTATMNGVPAVFDHGAEDDGNYPVVYYTFYVPDDNEIGYIDIIGVTAPVAGETANFEFLIPEGSMYGQWLDETGVSNWAVTDTAPESIDDIYDADWLYDPEYGPDTDGNDTSLVFEGGKYYTFIAWVEADEGYHFSENSIATVNGNEAPLDLSDYSSDIGYLKSGVFFVFYCPEWTYGDVNDDGEIGPFDASLILRYDAMLIDTDVINLNAADVSGDNLVNPFDASLILRYDAMLIDQFPACS